MTDIDAARDDGKPATTDSEIVKEANERWKACKEWQGVQDERTREDIKFSNGDARNAWQWPTNIYEDRTTGGNDLPCLTINNTRTHNDLIINDLAKNAWSVKVRPVAGKASYKSAELMEALVRRTENISKASTQYRKVSEQQVDGGIGYILIETKYVSNKTRNQDIYLKASRDPTAVYLDPWIREPDGSDANFGFVFDRMPRKEFNRKYPAWKNKVGNAPLSSDFMDWVSDKEIMLVKYYRKSPKADLFVWYEKEDGEGFEGLASEMREDAGNEVVKQLLDDIKEERLKGGTRKVSNDEVEWFLIAGDKIIEEGEWAGKYIPICRCVGRELVIDATLDRKGHTRPLIDAQRMLNYNASTAVQHVALQPKSPWLAPARAIEGQEQWKTANVDNFAVLVYNDIDDEAPTEMQKVDAPQRIEPPAPSAAYTQGMQDAERQMMMISGQFQAQMGENDEQSAASGKAINARQKQGDTATYHFVEHMTDMKRFIGVQLLDLYPKIYDTKRVLHDIGEDGEKVWIQIDPDQKDAAMDIEERLENEAVVKLALNPSIGEYECISDPGPDFATQRQEAWNATSVILQQNVELAGVIGDLLFRNGDFPGADEIADRMKKEIQAAKPYLFNDGEQPQLMALQQANQRLTALNGELMTKLADEKLKVRGRDERNDIKAYDSETARMKVLIEAIVEKVVDEREKARMAHELVVQGNQHVFDTIQQANQSEIDQQNQQVSNGQNA